jgi:hypothetical protein
MTTLILRNTTPVENRKLPSRFHSYIAIDKDKGEKIADITWSYRPKNAGGSAWQAMMPRDDVPGCTGVSVYSSTIPKLCEIVRHRYTGEGEAPRHWR